MRTMTSPDANMMSLLWADVLDKLPVCTCSDKRRAYGISVYRRGMSVIQLTTWSRSSIWYRRWRKTTVIHGTARLWHADGYGKPLYCFSNETLSLMACLVSVCVASCSDGPRIVHEKSKRFERLQDQSDEDAPDRWGQYISRSNRRKSRFLIMLSACTFTLFSLMGVCFGVEDIEENRKLEKSNKNGWKVQVPYMWPKSLIKITSWLTLNA